MPQDDRDKVRSLTDADRRLIETMREMQAGSLETLEAAARQIITLVTSLLGLFFGILAFKDKPDFLALTEIKVLSMLAMGAYFVALFFALAVVIPRKYHPEDLGEMRATLETMLGYKRNTLRWAVAAFGTAVLLMLVIAFDLLIRL